MWPRPRHLPGPCAPTRRAIEAQLRPTFRPVPGTGSAARGHRRPASLAPRPQTHPWLWLRPRSPLLPWPPRLPPASAPTRVPHRSAAKKPHAEGGCGVLPLAQPQDWDGGGGRVTRKGRSRGHRGGPGAPQTPGLNPRGPHRQVPAQEALARPAAWAWGRVPSSRASGVPRGGAGWPQDSPGSLSWGRRKGWRWQALPSAALCVSTWKHSSARVELCNQGVRAHVHARARFSGSLLRAVHDPVCSRGCGGAAGPILKLRERGAAPSLVSE